MPIVGIKYAPLLSTFQRFEGYNNEWRRASLESRRRVLWPPFLYHSRLNGRRLLLCSWCLPEVAVAAAKRSLRAGFEQLCVEVAAFQSIGWIIETKLLKFGLALLAAPRHAQGHGWRAMKIDDQFGVFRI